MPDPFKALVDHRVLREAGEIYLGPAESGSCYLSVDQLTEHAHLLGRTGSGKTRLLQHLAGELAERPEPALLVLDPYGGLAHYLKDYCYQNDLTERLVTLDASDALTHGILTGFDPLIRAASPQAAAAASTLALKSALGETGELAATPRLGKWSYATFLGLRRGDLTMADARQVVNPGDPTYREIFAEILLDTDRGSAGLWRWMVTAEGANPAQAARVFEEQLGSLANRLALYTQIPQIAAMLQTQRYALNALSAMQERRVVVANLSRFTPSGLQLYTEHEQKLLGTQILHTFLAAALSRQPKDRTPLFVMVDEFQLFLCPEVAQILSGGRQFGIHLILAHQFLNQLQDVARDDWRYYQAVIGQPKVRMVFGQGGIVDTETMAREIHYKDVDPRKVKDEIFRTVQTSRQEWVTITSESSGGGDSSMSGSGSGSGSGSAYRGGDESGFFKDPDPMVESFSSAMNSYNASGSSSWYASSSSTVPVNVPSPERLELGSREFQSVEEQFFLYAQKIHSQEKQHAVLSVRGKDAVFFRVADVPEPEHDPQEIQPLDRERLETATRVALPSPDGVERFLAGRVEDITEEARARDAKFRKLLQPRAKARGKADAKKALTNLKASEKKRLEE